MKMRKWLKRVAAVVMAMVLIMAEAGASQAASKGYVFSYKGVSVTMNGNATKLLKKAGTPIKKKESKSCAYKGLDRVYQYKDITVATYSNTKTGKQYVNGIKFRTNKVATKEGIRLGSSLNDVLKKYGRKNGTENFGVYTFKKGKCKLQFEITDGKVTTIQYVAIK